MWDRLSRSDQQSMKIRPVSLCQISIGRMFCQEVGTEKNLIDCRLNNRIISQLPILLSRIHHSSLICCRDFSQMSHESFLAMFVLSMAL